MSQLSLSEYQNLTNHADVLAEDGFGEKVLRLKDGNILKLFRVKRWWSSALLVNYAKRFYNNAQLLAQKNVSTVKKTRYIDIPAIKRAGVIYEPLSGANIRDIATRHNHALSEEIIVRLGAFIAELHNKGIYFRSLHLGNIILTAENELGIIDIADLKIKKKALSGAWRLRNMQHIKRYTDDIELLQCGQNNVFLDAYVASAKPKFLAKEVEQLKLLLKVSS
jgi:tRNA A-37 threonylcarbamoyl transferase component Bud32